MDVYSPTATQERSLHSSKLGQRKEQLQLAERARLPALAVNCSRRMWGGEGLQFTLGGILFVPKRCAPKQTASDAWEVGYVPSADWLRSLSC